MTARPLIACLLGLSVLLGLPACGKEEEPKALPEPPTAAPTPEPPKAGSCYRLTFEQANSFTTTNGPLACRHEHTAETFYVGRFDAIADGHLVAVDSDRVVEQVKETCPRKFAEYVGGDTEIRRLSRFETTWFAPTLEQSDRGETWFRCDLIALAGEERLLLLPKGTRGILDREGILDDYGTCGTARPDKPEFVRVACKRPHKWRAVATVDIRKDARYGGARATQESDDACRDVAAARSDDPLKWAWSFEWPNRDLWGDGQRWGLCWVPDPD